MWNTGLTLLSLGALLAAGCGRSAPQPSGEEAGAELARRCAPRDTEAKERRRFRLDWNGDGIDDLALPTAGGMAIWLGSRAGLGDDPAIRLAAPANSDWFGEAFTPIGDLDADGFGDLVVAAPATVTLRERGEVHRGGAAFLYRGGPVGTAPARLTVLGTAPYFGSSLGTGDLDGDGRLELVAATPSYWGANIHGRVPRLRAGVYVYGGDLKPHALWPADPDATDVMEVAGGGDLDGDGCDDVIVRVEPVRDPTRSRDGIAAFTKVIELRVYTGGTDGIDPGRYRVLARGAFSSRPDMLVVPDFDGDGRAGLAVKTDTGRVLLARFNSWGAGARIELVFPFERASVGYLATGDFDGDGRSELVAGSHQSSTIVVYRGGTPAVAPITLTTPSSTGLFPARLSVGDFDGDGRDDLVVTGGFPPDRFWIYRGRATAVLEAPVGPRALNE